MDIQEFIKKNNLKLRTQEELKEKFDELRNSTHLFSFQIDVLIFYLTFEDTKIYLKEEFLKEIEAGTKQWLQITTIERCIQDFLDYMEFAFGKAENQRGLSACRSIDKLSIWLWIMNREDLYSIITNEDLYNPYGAPALIEVCDKMDIKVPDSLREFAKVKCY